MIKPAISHIKFLKHKPLVTPRVISGFFKKVVLRQNVLRTVDFAITGSCHYKCVFCSAARLYKRGEPFLTVEQIRDIWKQCVELGAFHINLTGGEPLLRDTEEICQIIKNLRPSHFLVSLVTNANHLTKDKLKKFKDSGLDTLQLSIESIDPQKHDEMVGVKGNFSKTMQALAYAKECGLSVCINVVFYRGNSDEITKLITFSKKAGAFLVLNNAATEGNWYGENSKRLLKEDVDIFVGFMHNLHVRHDSVINFSGKMECPGGKDRIHITAYGDVLTCPLVQISYGNVLERPLKEIYKRMSNMEHIKKYSRFCKQAFDEDYYKEVLLPIEKIEKRPVLISDHPLYRQLKL